MDQLLLLQYQNMAATMANAHAHELANDELLENQLEKEEEQQEEINGLEYLKTGTAAAFDIQQRNIEAIEPDRLFQVISDADIHAWEWDTPTRQYVMRRYKTM